MTKQQQGAYSRTLVVLAEDCPGVPLAQIVEACEVFEKAARALGNIYTRHANGYKGHDGGEDLEAKGRDERAERRWQEKVAIQVQTLGLRYVNYTGLPCAGIALQLALPSGRSNYMGGMWAILWV